MPTSWEGCDGAPGTWKPQSVPAWDSWEFDWANANKEADTEPGSPTGCVLPDLDRVRKAVVEGEPKTAEEVRFATLVCGTVPKAPPKPEGKKMPKARNVKKEKEKVDSENKQQEKQPKQKEGRTYKDQAPKLRQHGKVRVLPLVNL